MLEGILKVESELRRQGQELAVAWRRGKARYVLDSLSAETPARSATSWGSIAPPSVDPKNNASSPTATVGSSPISTREWFDVMPAMSG